MNTILEKFRRERPWQHSAWRWRRAWDLVFLGLLAWATIALIRPIWVGPMSPMTDFGGHVAMADVWARYDEVPLYQELYERRSGWAPNLLSARFVGWFYPLLDVLSATRLFVSLTMLATVLALMGALKSFGRSRWLVFLGLPFLWNGSFYWGMINFLPTIPLFFAGIAIAHQAGRRGGWGWAAALTSVGILSFLTHGMGFVFVIAASAFVLFFSLKRPRRLLQFGALMPSLLIWMRWRQSTGGDSGLPGQGLRATLRDSARWWEPDKAFMEVIRYALDATVSQKDTVLGVLLLLIWIVLLALSRRPKDDPPAALDQAPPSPKEEQPELITARFPAFSALKQRLEPIFRRLSASKPAQLLRIAYGEAQENIVLLVILCLALGLLTFPAYILATNVKTRVMPLFVFALVLLPTPPKRSFLAAAALAAAICASLWWGYFLQHEAHRFAAQEMAPLVELSEHIPRQSRVECLGTRPMPAPIFWYYPLDHSCPGLIQIRRDSFGGNGFAGTGFNPVAFRKGHVYMWLRGHGFSKPARLKYWDYVVIRGNHRRPHKRVAELVAERKADVEGAKTWYLYRVIPPEADDKPE